MSVDISVTPRHLSQLEALVAGQTTPGSAQYHHWLTPAQFQTDFGVTDAELSAAAKKLSGSGLTISRTGAQSVAVSGTVADIDKAFAAHLQNQANSNGTTRLVSTTPLSTPTSLASLNAVPIDLSPMIRQHTGAERFGGNVPDNRDGAYGGYWFDDLKQAYQYPAFGDDAAHGEVAGKGQNIGIVIDSAVDPSDTAAYFGHEGLPAPTVTNRPVAGGSGPFNPNDGDAVEASLDVQQSGGIAPNAHITVYDIPDLSDKSIFEGYVAVDQDDSVEVANSSFGGCELDYTPAYNNGVNYEKVLEAYHYVFLQGNSQGITFDASSGDSGALGCPPPAYFNGTKKLTTFKLGVENPADDTAVTAVGGTNLVTNYTPGSLDSSYVGENANADSEKPYDPYGVGGDVAGGYWGSGGGFSKLFPEPAYQRQDTSNTTGERSVPDVSLQMGGCPGGISLHCNPEDSYVFAYFDGQIIGLIGTSASAPELAGTVALYDEVHGGRAGNINPALYAAGAAQRAGKLKFPIYHDSIPGNNGYYNTAYTSSGGTTGGFDEVLGNGTLIAKNLIFGTDSTPAAGVPQTPSNP